MKKICFWCFQNVAKNPQPKLGRTSADLASRMSGVAEVVRFGRSDQGRDAELGRDALSLTSFFCSRCRLRLLFRLTCLHLWMTRKLSLGSALKPFLHFPGVCNGYSPDRPPITFEKVAPCTSCLGRRDRAREGAGWYTAPYISPYTAQIDKPHAKLKAHTHVEPMASSTYT